MADIAPQTSQLFTPLALRGITAPNRIVISPMCQYSAADGLANDWHFAHLAKFALGGAGIVFCEAAAVGADARITNGDLGIWSAAHADALKPTVAFLKAHGAVPAMQLAHAGRKASMQRPWFGNGPMDDDDVARGERMWQPVAPSPLAVGDGWLVPHEVSTAEIAAIRENFVAAAGRTLATGFDILELHQAHGYLGHSFLSPISNQRNDAYGGDLAGRMRFTLELVEAVRGVWPADKPLFVRISSVDAVDGGWQIDDSVALARELKRREVDVIDCSSAGIGGPATAARIPRGFGFQVPFAEQIRRDGAIATMAVGLIVEPEQAEAIVAEGRADLVAIAREALYDPFWPHHAAQALGVDPEFANWPVQYGWWLTRRA